MVELIIGVSVCCPLHFKIKCGMPQIRGLNLFLPVILFHIQYTAFFFTSILLRILVWKQILIPSTDILQTSSEAKYLNHEPCCDFYKDPEMIFLLGQVNVCKTTFIIYGQVINLHQSCFAKFAFWACKIVCVVGVISQKLGCSEVYFPGYLRSAFLTQMKSVWTRVEKLPKLM